MGDLDAAERHLARHRQLRSERLGAAQADTLETTRQFANLLLEKGQFEERRVCMRTYLNFDDERWVRTTPIRWMP